MGCNTSCVDAKVFERKIEEKLATLLANQKIEEQKMKLKQIGRAHV